MTEDAIRMIFDMSDERIRETETAFHRYLYSEVDWNARLIALDGPRGVGKTTMFLQHLKENPVEAESSLYVSIDNIWLNAQDARGKSAESDGLWFKDTVSDLLAKYPMGGVRLSWQDGDEKNREMRGQSNWTADNSCMMDCPSAGLHGSYLPYGEHRRRRRCTLRR